MTPNYPFHRIHRKLRKKNQHIKRAVMWYTTTLFGKNKNQGNCSFSVNGFLYVHHDITRIIIVNSLK